MTNITESRKIIPTILEPTGDSEKNLQVMGIEFEAELDSTTVKTIQFSEDRDFQGVNIEISNHTIGPSGDTLRVAIEAYIDNDWVEARVLARGEGVNDGCVIPSSGIVGVVAEGTAFILTSYRLSFKYLSTATTGDKPYITALLRTWF